MGSIAPKDMIRLYCSWGLAALRISDLYQVLNRHPGVVPMFVAGPMFGTRALAAGEVILELLGRAGFDSEAAARALYPLLVYTIGFAAMDAAELPDGPAPAMAERVSERRTAFEAVPAETYPRTRKAAAVMAEYVTSGQFNLWTRRTHSRTEPAPPGMTSLS